MTSGDPTHFPNPSHIMDLATAYWNSQALLTANRVGLFAVLQNGQMGVTEIAGKLGTAARPTRLLLNACVGLNLLVEKSGQYQNSPQSAAFLVPGNPGFLGNAIRYADNLYNTWGELEKALRDDQPPMQTDTYTGDDQAITRDFVYGMHDRAIGVGRALVELVDLSGRKNMLDVGGGPGTYSCLFAQRYPELTSTVLDLPGVAAHAAEIIADMGASDRVSTAPGDYTSTTFPANKDVVLISGVFHRESVSGCRALIAKAHQALNPGGLLVISDVFADAGGTSPAFATLFGLNMLLTAPDGGVHADADVAQWMREDGFAQVQCVPFPQPMPHRVVSGIRS